MGLDDLDKKITKIPSPRMDEDALTKILNSIRSNTIIRDDKGKSYEVVELPNEENGNEYVLKLVGAVDAVIGFPLEELSRLFKDGRVALVPPEDKKNITDITKTDQATVENQVNEEKTSSTAEEETERGTGDEIKRAEDEATLNKLRQTIAENAEIIEKATRRLAEIERERKALLEQKDPLAEDRKKNPFKYFLIDKMDDRVFELLFRGNRKNELELGYINTIFEETGRKIKYFNPPYTMEEYYNTIKFTSNGFSLQLLNAKEVIDKDGYGPDKKSSKARYRLVYPDFTTHKEDGELNYRRGTRLLEKKAKEYQREQLALFEKQNKK